MSDPTADRSRYFPAIETKHGQPIAHWFERLSELDSSSYPAQMALLQNEHGFSRTHANAVVMYHRGSTNARRFETPDAYFASVGEHHRATMRRIFDIAVASHPDLELVVAWNQPVLRSGRSPVLGISAATAHLTINPFSTEVLHTIAARLVDVRVNKHTFSVPVDWAPDTDLVVEMVTARLGELEP